MVPDFRNAHAFLGINGEDSTDEVLGVLRKMVGKGVGSAEYLLVEGGGVRVLERQIAAKAGEEYHPGTPEIDSQADVLLTSNHLRSRIAGAPARSFEQLVLFVGVG